MVKFRGSKFVFIVFLSAMFSFTYSGMAQAEITVSDPVIDDSTGGNFPGTYGECFFLLANPNLDRCEEEVGPESYLTDADAYRSPSDRGGCFQNNNPNVPVSDHGGDTNVCFGNPSAPLNTLPVVFDGFSVSDFSVYRVDNDPDQAIIGIMEPDIAFAWSTIAGPNGGQYEFIPCDKALPLAADRFTTFDSEFVEDTAVTEIKVNQTGSIQLAYYFVNAADVCRELFFELFINGNLEKSGTIGDFESGKYLVFDIGGLEGAETIILETTLISDPNATPTTCGPSAPIPGVNAHISGVFIDNCEPEPVPCLELEKKVSGDGGVNFLDADDCGDTDVPFTDSDAEYLLEVKNCGEEPVNIYRIKDDDLGIDLTLQNPITIDPDDTFTFTNDSGDTSGKLFKADVCPDTQFENTATVFGTGDISGDPVEATDPACVKCKEEAGCLTRSPGFWCTHDRVTELFLPVDSCGITLDNTDAATPGSAIEDLNFSGRDFNTNDTSPQQLQLIRQCTAAALNFTASAEAGGSCSDIVLSDGRTIEDVFDECCVDLCSSGASGPTISGSNCIERLDEFNNLEPDTLTCETDPQAPFPFCPSLGANGFNATPATCEEANGNGFVNPGRNLGLKNGAGRRR